MLKSLSCIAPVAMMFVAACLGGCAVVSKPEPVLRDARRHPGGLLSFQSVVGAQTYESTGAAPDRLDRDAQIFASSLEGVGQFTGGGFSLGLAVDDGLSGDNNPAMLHTSDVYGVEFFGHLTLRPTGGERFRMPIRIGPYISHTSVADSGPTLARGQTTDYAVLGLRLEVEPELDFFQENEMVASVFVKQALGGGVAGVSRGIDEETFDTRERNHSFGIGVRFRVNKFHSELGYVYRYSEYDETDSEVVSNNLMTLPGAEFEFTGLMISMGIRW